MSIDIEKEWASFFDNIVHHQLQIALDNGSKPHVCSERDIKDELLHLFASELDIHDPSSYQALLKLYFDWQDDEN